MSNRDIVENQWFVVLANPQRETVVEEQLENLGPYCPRFKSDRGRVKPLFPGYLFLPQIEYWWPVLTTVGVRAMLMSGDQPARIPDSVIKSWKDKERGGLVQLPPPPRFRKGERLVITRGSLRHRVAIHSEMVGRDRERVLIELLGQWVTLTVPTTDLVAESVQTARDSLRKRRETLMGQKNKQFPRPVSARL